MYHYHWILGGLGH